VETFFLSVPHVRVKRYIAVPIKLGATAKEGDFIEEGEAYYVHPGATKKQGVIPLDDCYQVSAEYYEENRRRAGLKLGDVIINRSGEAHGKVAYWDSSEPAVGSDFNLAPKRKGSRGGAVARRTEGENLTRDFSSPRHRASARYLFLVAAPPRWDE
jgi:hypothetical protein